MTSEHLFLFEAGAVPLPPLGPDGRYSQTPEELLSFALSFCAESSADDIEIEQSDDKESTELKRLPSQLDISSKILQWVQGVKILAPVAVVFVVWVFKYSPELWATRAVNPWNWGRNWAKAKKAKAEANGITDVELGVLGAEMANSKLLRMAERMDRMNERITSNQEDAEKKISDIIVRTEELERPRAGPFDGSVRHRGGFRRLTPSPRKFAGQHDPEVPKDQ
ncbi:hypothetical protein N7481_002770 [Penicillium waksmanii]|uniref:uncharacterized protein n=1 Tax=Penicillium waksmanii TaxID=69791 RepID=UPI0025489C11|nr:uncharacterized protein N7481_002770 [Penicillium waksmanii]KAJ5995793.1 hypothetical protein N7481_002770 [Penicillium waksmanii]